MQDEIVARLASALHAELVAAEARRSEQVPNPDSMDLYFQGMACFHRAPSPDALRQGQSFFERALALDPGFIEARVGLGTVQSAITALLAIEDRPAGFAAAESVLKQVLSVAPDHVGVVRAARFGLDWISNNRAEQSACACGDAHRQRAPEGDPYGAGRHSRAARPRSQRPETR
jgi:hypothetical protein